ncbi:MAG: HAD-IA family hydrolase [Patescibacteria group bacterium]
MDKIKFIYFDIGNVMADTNGYFKDATQKFNIPLSEFTDFWNGNNGADEITRGKISAREFWQTAIKKFGIKNADEFDFLESWLNDYKPILETHGLAKKLSESYRIGLISNLYPGMIDRLIKRGLIADIDYSAKILSCEVGLRKPERGIFELATKMSGFGPGEIFFIDDRVDFVKAAEDYGWKTYLFDLPNKEKAIEEIEKILL